ncbi:MAG: hypothetical protein J2P28_16495 [Actinobacteria bacterium]|nr:hypothetical protein [Actinomycetota bacterium]
MRETVRWRRTAEHVAVLLFSLLVLAVHDVGYLLSQPFWNDEAWVAVTTRLPLSQLPATTLSTPIGWSVLMRFLTVGGEQTSRLLPLAFAGAGVVITYWFGRGLGWARQASVVGGVLAGTAVLLVPAMLVRDDLKQYTADACMALLVLALTSRLEREWSRLGLVILSTAVWGGMVFSDASAFTGIAAFAALCVVQFVQRAWRRLAEAAVVGAGTALLMLAVYEAFDARAVAEPGLTAYWSRYYLPVGQNLHTNIEFIITRLVAVRAGFGLGPAWLALPLVLAGLVTIFRLGRPATAVTITVLWPEMLAVSAVQRYPFLDLRTSTFLFAITAAVAAIGVAGACSLLQTRLKGTLAAGLAALATATFVIHAQPYVRSHRIPREDVRDQALYVAAHAARSDVILVNLTASFGFAYYWPVGAPARRPDATLLPGYEPYFPDQPDIVVARSREPGGIDAALSQAEARRHACGRLWLVASHETRLEKQAVTTALHRQKLTPTPVGKDGLSVVSPDGSRCH